jgi:hypothetical protein
MRDGTLEAREIVGVAGALGAEQNALARQAQESGTFPKGQ